METNKGQIRPEFKQIFSSLFRETWMKLSYEAVKNLLLVFVKTHIENETEDFKKEIALKTLNELMPAASLLGAIKAFGTPKSLVFISESGRAIDLLEIKELDENETFNQVLDNLHTVKQK